MKYIRKISAYIILSVLGIFMIYPVLWLIGASFKSNSEIFSSIWFMPEKFDFTPYINGWKTSGSYTMGHYFLNTFKIVIPRVIFSVVSSTVQHTDLLCMIFRSKRLYSVVLCVYFLFRRR